MQRPSEQPSLECPIDLYPRQDPDIQRLNAEINRHRNAADKADYARELLQVVGVLLDCDAYDDGNLNCRLCRQFAGLRMKAADLIIAASGAASGAAPRHAG